MTQSFVRLAILVDGERCAEGCPYADGGECTLAGGDTTSRRWLTGLTSSVADGFRRTDLCLSATTQQALDDAVLEAAERFHDKPVGDDADEWGALTHAVVARRSATREGGT